MAQDIPRPRTSHRLESHTIWVVLQPRISHRSGQWEFRNWRLILDFWMLMESDLRAGKSGRTFRII